MDLYEVSDQIVELLRKRGRLAYRALKLQFHLDDEQLAALTEDLLFTHPEIAEEGGRGLVWGDASPVQSSMPQAPRQNSEDRPPTSKLSPASYTPPHLAERIRATSITDGERKTITALFADLKGSTALIEGLDPEEARALIDPALQVMMEAVHRYEGYVAQALGDGIFALFGAPIAHEDHPQRALYAALRMQEEMRRYSDTLRAQGFPPLLMRVGIHTGEVVVRSIRKDDLHADYVPVGHSTNLAARMEQLAAPGSIVVSAYTHRLTDGYFAFKDLGPTQIKGVEDTLHIYEVIGAGPLRTRLQVSASRYGLTRFVGRQQELEQLKQALAQAKVGHGQLVGVMGEPGLGKSRLFYEFKILSQAGCLVLEAYSVSHGKATAYLPVIELLKSYFDIQTHDEERKRREKVTGKVLTLDRSLEDTLPYLFALLGLAEQPSPLQHMDPQIRRRRTFEALKKLFLRESLNQPLVLIFEDLHWIDGETQGLLDTLSESVASAKILLLTNYRPEYRHEWGQKTYYTQLRLAPFGRVEAEEFLTSLLGTDPSLTAITQLILEKTEGTPFFMEEMVQTLVEDGTLTGERGHYRLMRAVVTWQLPTTVQGVLAARIDRLTPEEKSLLQQLAVIGRVFPLSLARQVVQQSEETLYRLLSSLQHKEFLYEQPAFPEVEYIFKHALTQEVAYNSVLHEHRKALHEQTAHTLETLYRTNLEEHYNDLAHHYSRSGNTQKAVDYLHRAGQQAVQRSANMEALTQLTAAVEFLKSLPDSLERASQELALQLALIAPLIATKGYTTAELENIYVRAQTLCQQVGDALQLFPVLFGQWVFAMVRAECTLARELAEQFLGLAQQEHNPEFLLLAHALLGDALFKLGEFSAAQSHFEQTLRLYDPTQHHTLTFLYGQDPKVVALSYLSLTLWFLGYPEQALQKDREVLAYAQALSQPLNIAWAYDWTAVFHQYLGDKQTTQERAEAAVTISTEHGFPYFLAWGAVLRGWAVNSEKPDESITLIRQGLAAYRANGAEIWRPYFLALLAEAYEKAGQIEDGLAVLAEALTTIDATGERNFEAEIYRLKGELTLQSKASLGQVEDTSQTSRSPSEVEKAAEECFVKAIEVAQKQQAKSLELRAVISLARLRQRQAQDHATRSTQHETRKKLDEAHRLLSEVYNWFTEGFDTKDLQEAKELIEELRH